MDWKDGLRPASFRGVEFFVDSSQFTGGRRNVFHEFPDRDSPYSEDTGKSGRVFKVEGHLLGDDYFAQKTAMLDAVEKFGPGELIHPYYGTILVQCGPFSIDEDTKEGRIAKISFQFYEAGDNRYPKSVAEKQIGLDDKVLAAQNAAKKDFDKAFSIAKAPGYVVDSARSGVNKAADLFGSSTKTVKTVADEAANLAYGIRNLKAEVNDLMQSPSKLSKRLQDSFGLLQKAVEKPTGKVTSLKQFFGFGDDQPVSSGITPNRDRERGNTDALNNLMQRTAVAAAVGEASTVDYDSTEGALAEREGLSNQIEQILQETNDDDVFAAFEDLNGALVKVLPDDESDLPNIQTVSIQDTNPSLVVAYDLFERPEVEADLISRNKIRNPAFIQGGSVLEVLNVRSST